MVLFYLLFFSVSFLSSLLSRFSNCFWHILWCVDSFFRCIEVSSTNSMQQPQIIECFGNQTATWAENKSTKYQNRSEVTNNDVRSDGSKSKGNRNESYLVRRCIDIKEPINGPGPECWIRQIINHFAFAPFIIFVNVNVIYTFIWLKRSETHAHTHTNRTQAKSGNKSTHYTCYAFQWIFLFPRLAVRKLTKSENLSPPKSYLIDEQSLTLLNRRVIIFILCLFFSLLIATTPIVTSMENSTAMSSKIMVLLHWATIRMLCVGVWNSETTDYVYGSIG